MAQKIVQPLIIAVVIGTIGLVSVLAQQAWLIPSLGSASFVQILEPTQPSAKPYSTAVGQLLGIAGGFTGLFLAQAFAAPLFTAAHPLAVTRVAAVVIAVLVTAALQLATEARSAAGGTIALLVTLGLEKPDRSAVGEMVVGIVLVTLLGEAGRRIAASTGPATGA